MPFDLIIENLSCGYIGLWELKSFALTLRSRIEFNYSLQERFD